MNLNIIIVDDEPNVTEFIKALIERNFNDVNILTTIYSFDEAIKLIPQYSNNSRYLHTLARLGSLNGSICKYFHNYSSEQEIYCLKKYFDNRFLCNYSPDKRECYFFDTLINDKNCNELRDPILITDCELFKEYYGEVNCTFFQEIGSNEYMGYICALKSKNCDGDYYYDKMYYLICKYWTKKENK